MFDYLIVFYYLLHVVLRKLLTKRLHINHVDKADICRYCVYLHIQ